MKGKRIGPVQRTLLYEQVVDTFIRMVEDGQLAPGDPLPPERELAEQLGVGRTALREALRVLEVMGIITVSPNVGISVSPYARGALHFRGIAELVRHDPRYSILEVRKVLEPEVAALAAARASDGEIAAIERIHLELKARVESSGDWIDSDMRFHATIAEATQNFVFAEIVRSFTGFLHSIIQTRQIADPLFVKKVVEEHERILGAIVARDSWKAAAYMKEHLGSIESFLIGDIDEQVREEHGRFTSRQHAGISLDLHGQRDLERQRDAFHNHTSAT